MNLPEALLPYVSNELTGGEELVEIYATEAIIVMHTRSSKDGDVLRWAEWDGRQYAVYRKVIGKDFWLQTSNAAGNLAEIFIEGEPYYQYRLTLANRKMHLHSVWGEQVYFIIEPHALCNDGTLTTCTNDGYVYGNHQYYDVKNLPFAEFPTSYAQAVQQLDNTRWAVVNNPKPTDRLHLREQPDRKSVSLGKFYNRTPVYVDEIRGEWAHVSIGRDLSGWMMTDYLAFGADMDKVACAFPQLTVKDEHQEYEADEFVYEYRVFTAPDFSADAMRWNSMESYYLIGVTGDFYIIMNSEETIGYIPQDWLWAGNG